MVRSDESGGSLRILFNLGAEPAPIPGGSSPSFRSEVPEYGSSAAPDSGGLAPWEFAVFGPLG